ncbi:hypothetical protein I79_000197 [Cricetulus griseus]|uniref:Uncharacterized protein n=1 Tax=Cricetulus griseus TaxID=10029 RepID=G3GRQ4_CRIGR|nr:hypothetical protein I79_000197 [Cricetulus griseus]
MSRVYTTPTNSIRGHKVKGAAPGLWHPTSNQGSTFSTKPQSHRYQMNPGVCRFNKREVNCLRVSRVQKQAGD